MQPEQALLSLLRDQLFSGEVSHFRRWLDALPDSRELGANLPGPTASTEEVMASAVNLLMNRGRVDRDFFYRLLMVRPSMHAAISTVMQAWFGEHVPAQGADLVPESSAKFDREDITPRLLAGSKVIELAAGSANATARVLPMSPGSATNWVLNGVFSPPLPVKIGPQAVISVQTPHYLSFNGTRKAPRAPLDGGPAEVTVVQSQPSLRRTTMSIVRGTPRGDYLHFALSRGLCFAVHHGLPGLVVALEAPETEPMPLIIWFLEVP